MRPRGLNVGYVTVSPLLSLNRVCGGRAYIPLPRRRIYEAELSFIMQSRSTDQLPLNEYYKTLAISFQRRHELDPTLIHQILPRVQPMAETAQSTATVATLSQQCTQRFETIKILISSISIPDAQSLPQGFTTILFLDIFTCFRIWTGNIGALQQGRASLDHRIQHSHVYDEVKRLLGQVALALLDCRVTRLRST